MRKGEKRPGAPQGTFNPPQHGGHQFKPSSGKGSKHHRNAVRSSTPPYHQQAGFLNQY